MVINIPTKLEDITIGQLMAYEKSEKSNIDIVECLCSIDNAKQIPIKEFKDLVNHLNELLKSEVTFKKTFVHNGITFGFVPNLEKLSGGEFIDLDNYIKEYHKFMAVLFRPVIKTRRNWFKRGADDLYDIQSYIGTEKWSDEMLNVPCTYYLGAMVFFYNLKNDLINYLQDYSVQIAEKLELKKSNNSMQNGVGM